MKKVAAILFFVLYLTGVMGLTLTVHYCGDDLKYFSIAGDQEDNCCDETEKSCCCCSDQVIRLQVSESHNLVKIQTVSKLPAAHVAVMTRQPDLLSLYSAPVAASGTCETSLQPGKLRLHLRNNLLLI